MPSNAFIPSLLDVVNQVLSELGRLPVDNVQSDQNALLISQRIPFLLPELLLRTPWNWAIKYVEDNNPITENFSPEYTYTYQLPGDYGRIFRFWQMWYNYTIVDNFILADQRPINYYYVINNADIDILPPLFFQLLVLYTASRVAFALTENQKLVDYLNQQYRMKLADAIRQNDMDRRIQTTPQNDFDRLSYI